MPPVFCRTQSIMHAIQVRWWQYFTLTLQIPYTAISRTTGSDYLACLFSFWCIFNVVSKQEMWELLTFPVPNMEIKYNSTDLCIYDSLKIIIKKLKLFELHDVKCLLFVLDNCWRKRIILSVPQFTLFQFAFVYQHEEMRLLLANSNFIVWKKQSKLMW